MSIAIDSKEVYEYLQELGYNNITSKQLREFIHDLKKLIKYEERKNRKLYDKENISQDIQQAKQSQDIFQNLYEKNTEASKAKIVEPKKEKVIRVQVKKHKETCRHYKPASNPNEAEARSSESIPNLDKALSQNKNIKSSQTSLNSKDSEKLTSTRESDKCVGTIPLNENGRKCSAKSSDFDLKAKASFIRPKSVKSAKSDPVSLYHKYQAEWKKQKIPGVDNHSNLRWVIREKMLGDYQQSTIPHSANLKKRFSKNSRV